MARCCLYIPLPLHSIALISDGLVPRPCVEKIKMKGRTRHTTGVTGKVERTQLPCGDAHIQGPAMPTFKALPCPLQGPAMPTATLPWQFISLWFLSSTCNDWWSAGDWHSLTAADTIVQQTPFVEQTL